MMFPTGMRLFHEKNVADLKLQDFHIKITIAFAWGKLPFLEICSWFCKAKSTT